MTTAHVRVTLIDIEGTEIYFGQTVRAEVFGPELVQKIATLVRDEIEASEERQHETNRYFDNEARPRRRRNTAGEINLD
jgi:hypothetical protein